MKFCHIDVNDVKKLTEKLARFTEGYRDDFQLQIRICPPSVGKRGVWDAESVYVGDNLSKFLVQGWFAAGNPD